MFNNYSTGTVSIGAGATSIVGSGSNWSGVNAKPGDDIVVAGHTVIVQDVVDATTLTIDAWPYTAVTTGTSYKIVWRSPLRYVGGQAMAAVDTMISSLNTNGLFWFVPVGATAPDPSYGSDGQYAYQPSTGAYWTKTGGVWVSSGSPAAGYGGTSTTSLTIGTGSKAFTTQSGLAYNGARVRATATSDVTKWLEGPATYSGTTLTIAADKSNGSGTITSWSFTISGQPATGDLISTNNLSDVTSAQTSRGNLGILSPPQGRLSLVTGTPVMTTSQASKTTLYYTLYTGSQAPVYDGTKFTMKTFTELSTATTDTTKSPAAIGASKVNDWFLWDDAGTLRISHGPDWTSDPTRSAGTALVNVNGVLLNNAGITNGPAASRGTYLGTTRSDASSQLNWVYGASAQAGNLAVWNMYNRVTVATTANESTASWSYSSATVRASNGGTAARISFVSGLAEESISASVTQGLNIASGTGSFAQFGMKMDATNAFDKYADPAGVVGSVLQLQGLTVVNMYAPQLGYHFVSQAEAGDGTTTTTFTGGLKHGVSLILRM